MSTPCKVWLITGWRDGRHSEGCSQKLILRQPDYGSYYVALQAQRLLDCGYSKVSVEQGILS